MSKRSLIFTFAALFCILLVACGVVTSQGSINVRGSGNIITRDYPLSGFTGISACCGFKVTVAGGDAFHVSVTADDNIVEVLSVRQEGGTLYLELDRSKTISIQSNRLEAAVTMPSLQRVDLSGGSRLDLAQPAPQADSFTMTGSGGSTTDLSAMAAQKASVTLSGGSHATLKVTGSLDYDLSGGSQLRFTGNPKVGSSQTSGGASANPF